MSWSKIVLLAQGASVTGDDIGNRAQWIFNLLITEMPARAVPYFRPYFLGDKYPTFDCIVHLVDHEGYFIFAQVKGTAEGYTKKENKLLIHLSEPDVDRMVSSPIPAYFFGVDILKECGFVLSINERRDHISSMCTTNQLDASNLVRLYDEVRGYWSSRDMVLKDSIFRE